MKTSQDEKSEETFKIDYGKLYKLLQSSTTMIFSQMAWLIWLNEKVSVQCNQIQVTII